LVSDIPAGDGKLANSSLQGRRSVLLVGIFKYGSHVKLLQLEGVVKTKFTLQLHLKINTEGHGMGHFYKVFSSLAN
jgi:hypothetical protein